MGHLMQMRKPTVTQLTAWSLFMTAEVKRINAEWAEAWTERGTTPPGGETLVNRDQLPAGILMRLPEGTAPGGDRHVGGRATICGRLAILFADEPGAIEAAVRQLVKERAELRRAEAGFPAGRMPR